MDSADKVASAPVGPKGSSNGIQTELNRDLGLISALAIGVGTMIAAGIFTLSGLAVGYVGSAAIASFLLAAIVALFTALTYCEFTSIYPESGEGYLYARRSFAPPLAYLVGWCLLLGYASSCAFYIASLSSYFNEFIWHSPFEMGAGLFALIALTLLNIKGTKESGTFQVVVTGGKLILLVWFIIGGLGHVDTETIVQRFSTDLVKIGSTAAMVFITFFGFSAIAASAGEVRNPTKTIPRAIFISMGLVTVMYTLVVLVVVAANLSEYTESAMGSAAKDFLGPIGGMVIVGGAIFSMISASNASVLAGSRVALSMAKLGHLPVEIGTINKRTHTPVVALMLVGVAIGGFALSLPLEELAHFADCVLLIALILVNAALIRHRRLYPGLDRPFRVPLMPLLPALGILANLYLLTQVPNIRPLLLAGASLILGVMGYLAWKGSQAEDKSMPGLPSRVALERSATLSARFRVLVPISNPANVDRLIDLAVSIAAQRQGEVVALRVVLVPEQLPPSLEEAYVERERMLLEQARARGRERDVPVSTIVRIGHSASRAILETARERDCDLIVLGWKGYTSTARRILGEVTDEVVSRARSDIMLVKLVGDRGFDRILLPSAGGEHAIRAEEYAADFLKGHEGSLTLCTVVPPAAPEEKLESEQNRLNENRKRIEENAEISGIETRILEHSSVSAGLISAAKEYDAVIVGAAGQSLSKTMLLGSIPEDIAREADSSVIVVKRYHPVSSLLQRLMFE